MERRNPIALVAVALPGSIPFWAGPYLQDWLWPVTVGGSLVVGYWATPDWTGFAVKRSVEAVAEGLSLVADLVRDVANGGRRSEPMRSMGGGVEGARAPVTPQREPAMRSRGALPVGARSAEVNVMQSKNVQPKAQAVMQGGGSVRSGGHRYADYLTARSLTRAGGADERECREVGKRLTAGLHAHGIGWELKGAQVRPGWFVFGFSPRKGVLGALPKKVEEDLPRMACVQQVVPVKFAGSTWVGLAVPRSTPAVLGLREVLESSAWQATVDDGTLPLLIGADLFDPKDLIVWDLAQVYHVIAGGKTGGGKTSWALAAILAMAISRPVTAFRLTVLDPKRVLETLHGLPHVRRVESAVDEILAALEERVAEMDDRVARLPAGYTLVQYNAAVPEARRLSHELIVLDEYPNLLRTAGGKGMKADIENAVNALTEKGGAAGYHVIIMAQKTTTDVMESATVNNCEPVSFKMGTAAASRALLRNKGGAELLPGKGAGLCFRGGELSRFQAALVERDEVLRVVTAMAAHAPPQSVHRSQRV